MRFRAELSAILLIAAVALGSAIGVSAFSAQPRSGASLPTPAPATPVRSPTPIPAVVPGPLDGQPTARANALRRPLAVVIDNFYPDARPNAGLADASIVYETLVEGGITRLLALFLEHGARQIGPIRSARPYFVDWANSYDALFVHAGGSPAALHQLGADRHVVDVEALNSSSAFYRLPSHVPPHDLFTGASAVWNRSQNARLSAPLQLPWPLFKPQAPPGTRGRGRPVTIDFSTSATASPRDYAVTYRYDRNRNVYLRSVGGVPSVDASGRRQIAPANVVILITSIQPIPNDPALRVSVRTTGSGRAVVLRDGTITRGRWSREGGSAPLAVRDARGRAVRLDRGSTWVEVVPAGAVRFGQ